MEITRQHETTTIDELSGSSCTNLLATGPGNDDGFHAWYFEASEVWYRFFIQHGILFWDTVDPDPEDDLAPGEDYCDVLKQNGLPRNEQIEAIHMKTGQLTISFCDGSSCTILENDNTGSMSIKIGHHLD
jgi:hypothetical protein